MTFPTLSSGFGHRGGGTRGEGSSDTLASAGGGGFTLDEFLNVFAGDECYPRGFFGSPHRIWHFSDKSSPIHSSSVNIFDCITNGKQKKNNINNNISKRITGFAHMSVRLFSNSHPGPISCGNRTRIRDFEFWRGIWEILVGITTIESRFIVSR